LNGAIFSFKAKYTNTGDMSVNLGQSSPGGLIGAQPLFMSDGSTEVPVGMVVSGRYYEVRYDSSLDVDGAFVLLGSGVYVPEVYTGQESVTLPNGFTIKSGQSSVAAGSSTEVIAFADDFKSTGYTIQISIQDGTGNDTFWIKVLNSPTISGFSVFIQEINTTGILHWTAMGY